jgi:hypothetical protein
VSPILVRPVREQLEHDRIIRLLQMRLKRRHEIAINIGEEQTAGVKVGAGQMFPDLVLTSPDRGKRLEGVVEVETGESVNHLEAMAQWAHFGRMRAPFHLYVPAAVAEIARRLCAEHQVNVAELWSYHTIGDQTRFTLVQRSAAAAPARSLEEQPRQRPAPAPRAARKAARPARKPAAVSRGVKSRGGRADGAGKGTASHPPTSTRTSTAPRAHPRTPTRTPTPTPTRTPTRTQKRK